MLDEPACMPTFVTETLRRDVQHLNHLILLNERLTQYYLSFLWQHASLLRLRPLTLLKAGAV